MVQPKQNFNKTGTTTERVPTAIELAQKRKSAIEELRKIKEKNAAEKKKEADTKAAAIPTSVKPAEVNIRRYKGIKPSGESSRGDESSKVSVYEKEQGLCRKFLASIKRFFTE